MSLYKIIIIELFILFPVIVSNHLYAKPLELPISMSTNVKLCTLNTIKVINDSIYFDDEFVCTSEKIDSIPETEITPVIPELKKHFSKKSRTQKIKSIGIHLDINAKFRDLFCIMNTILTYKKFDTCWIAVKNNTGKSVYLPLTDFSKKDPCKSSLIPLMIFDDTSVITGIQNGYMASLKLNEIDSLEIYKQLTLSLKKLIADNSTNIDSNSIILTFPNNYPYCKVIRQIDFVNFFGIKKISLAMLKTNSVNSVENDICKANFRSRESITKVIYHEIHALKEAYDRSLRRQPGIKGTIAVKFRVDQFGKVIDAQIVDFTTTISDTELQEDFLKIIKTWKFERINKPGDITEIVYPFRLSD